MKNVRISFKLFLAAIASAIIHNLIYVAFQMEEAIFFLLTFIFFLAALLTLLLGIIKRQVGK
jgi:hypothetical protein